MITYLSGCVQQESLAHPRADLGLMLQPRMGNQRFDLKWITWAADNGCFAQGASFDAGDWLEWLASMRRWRSTCLFACAPDVVGDWEATWERTSEYLPTIRQLGYRPALVAQNGMPYRLLQFIREGEALFIGGRDNWRFSSESNPSFFDDLPPHVDTNLMDLNPDVRVLIRYARRRGIHVHFGRVNSKDRLALVAGAGCNSADGTYTKHGPETNLPKLFGWLDAINGEMRP